MVQGTCKQSNGDTSLDAVTGWWCMVSCCWDYWGLCPSTDEHRGLG